MTATQRVRTKHFADFTGGDWGDIGPFLAADNMFSARNMVVTRDGALCPRAGLKLLSTSGIGNGVVLGIGYAPITSKQTWLVIGTALYYGDTSFAAASGSFSSAPTRRVKHKESLRLIDNEAYLCTDQGLYKFTYSTNTLAAVSGAQAGFDAELYRDRIYIVDDGTARVYYSDAADFATWGAGSFFDVGYQFDHQHVLTQRNTLEFLTDEYQWQLSGVPESTSVLRRVATAIPAARNAAVMSRDVIYYVPATRSAPVIYRGGLADENSLRRLEWTTADLDEVGCAANIDNDDLVFVAPDGSMLTRYNGIWTVHDAEVDLNGMVSRFSQTAFQLTDGGGAGAAAKLYRFNCHDKRPAFTSDTDRSPGDGSNTPVDAWLHLPQQWDAGGQLRRVRQVIVDFVSYDTGTTETAHFDVTVEAHNRPGQTGTEDATTQSFDEAVASSSTAGTERRAEFNIGEQGFAGGYQVKFTNIRSVKIRAVHVVYDEQTRDTR